MKFGTDIQMPGWHDPVSEGFIIIAKGVGHHPCPLPRGRKRRKLMIVPGSRIQCLSCQQVWEFYDYGDFRDWRRVDD